MYDFSRVKINFHDDNDFSEFVEHYFDGDMEPLDELLNSFNRTVTYQDRDAFESSEPKRFLEVLSTGKMSSQVDVFLQKDFI